MDQPATAWEQIRQWCELAISGATAMFAGLVWWMARKSLLPHAELLVDSGTLASMLITVRVYNPSPSTIYVDGVHRRYPRNLLLARLDTAKLDPAPTDPAWGVTCSMTVEIPPASTGAIPLLVSLRDRDSSASAISISLRIRTRSRVIPHKMAAVTARLPDWIKKHHD